MTKQIPLTGKLGKNKFALVDDVDYPELSKYRWFLLRSGYVVRKTPGRKGRCIYMHRQILQAPTGVSVDHRNGDKSDNRRCNLRFATAQQNNRNSHARRGSTSRFKGVDWQDGHWRARIQVDGRQINLGSFHTQREAAIAYNNAAMQYFGEFALLNSILDEPDPDDKPVQKPPPKRSRFRGVSWDYRRQRWMAKTKASGRFINIGRFTDEVEAAKAYDRVARLYHGDKAHLNFP